MRLALALLLLLALPAGASAGGFATVGLAPPPASAGPGDTWTAEMTVLQHGRTPMSGQSVSVVTRGAGGERSFAAKETARPGVYRAEVAVPAGTWRYAAVDPFGVEHGFAVVETGGAGPAGPFASLGAALAGWLALTG